MKFFRDVILTGAALGLMTSTSSFAAGHGGWTSVDEHSQIAFGSVKKDTIGEVHHFSGVKATIDKEGQLDLSIDLTSVETNIDIRNERIAKHVFKESTTTATVNGSIDMAEVEELETGNIAIADFEGTLTLAGVELDVEAEMLVARLAEDRVLVSTADFIMVSTEDLGINTGVDKLMALAKLPSITRVTPIDVRVLFEK